MTDAEKWEFHLCLTLQNPLGQLHNICMGDLSQYLGFQLPSGEIVTTAVLFPVGPALLKKTSELLMSDEEGFLLASDEVERQVVDTGLCLALEVRTGETSAHYWALSECKLIRKEQ